MAQSELPIFDGAPGEKKALDCVEIYLPKKLRFLSRLYRFLRQSVKYRTGQIALDGFTVFEGDGVFRGEKLWEERTLVIRILFINPGDAPEGMLEKRINDLGQEIAYSVALKEEEIWICYFPQSVMIFRRPKKPLGEDT